MTLSPGSKVGPYEILSAIGSGGMGSVYKAKDTRLGRTVAIKKVKEQHSERFKQEARYIAALNHPNICQIHDIGDDYLVLEYVEGKPLSSPLPEQEAVRLAIQIATALEEAHQHGIIHRDLKPSNIMVTDKGSVKLLDFGLAKLYEQDASISSLPTAEFPATQVGAILGTVAYMSPEQAQGQPADARSDIFSFGLVLYEMLSGRRAFVGDSTPETLAALLRDEPDPLKSFPALEKIVKRCLEKNPAERYQRVSELRAVLEKAVKPKVAASSEEKQPSIAVLPFVNMSGDKEQEYFSDGLAEEIINALTKIPGLKVPARTSAFAFRGKEQDITKIAEALRVKTILEGSVRKSGKKVRITAQLINASDGYHIWSERYDRDLNNVFDIQDEISHSIAEKLRVQLSGNQQLVKKPTDNIEAYNLNLKGRYYFLKLTQDGLAKGRECFEKAIAMDSNYAAPWHGLAAVYGTSGNVGITLPRIAYEQSRWAINKALELDNTLPEAHAHLGGLLTLDLDWTGAEKEFLRALELGPGTMDVWLLYGLYYLVPLKRLEEALVAIQKAQEIDPLSPLVQANFGYICILMGQYNRALGLCRNALELAPDALLTNLFLGLAHIMNGEPDKAIQIYEKATHTMGIISYIGGALGYAYAMAGRTSDAHRILEELHAAAQTTYVTAGNFAWIYMGLGETDKAFDWFDKLVEERGMVSIYISFTQNIEPIRSHARYKTLLRKMNLEP